MKILRIVLLTGFISIVWNVKAHVPFLKPNMFHVLHDRFQVEASFTELPFQADYLMVPTSYALIDAEGNQTVLHSAIKTRAAEYLEPELNVDGTYRINAGLRKGPKYRAIETAEGKLYFADDIPKKQGTMTSLQYYSSADVYVTKGACNYVPQLMNTGVEIIPLSAPNKLKTGGKLTFKVYENGKPVANARVVVAYENEHYARHRDEDLYDVDNERESNIYANNDGEFTFIPKKAGLVLLFVTIHHKIDNSLWESYNSSLTLEVNLP